MLPRWGWRLGISSSPCPHLDSTLQKSVRLLFHRDPGGEKMNRPRIECPRGPPVRFTLTSVPERSCGNQRLQPPPLIMGWHVLLFWDFFFSNLRNSFFKRIHLFTCTHLLSCELGNVWSDTWPLPWYCYPPDSNLSSVDLNILWTWISPTHSILLHLLPALCWGHLGFSNDMKCKGMRLG